MSFVGYVLSECRDACVGRVVRVATPNIDFLYNENGKQPLKPRDNAEFEAMVTIEDATGIQQLPFDSDYANGGTGEGWEDLELSKGVLIANYTAFFESSRFLGALKCATALESFAHTPGVPVHAMTNFMCTPCAPATEADPVKRQKLSGDNCVYDPSISRFVVVLNHPSMKDMHVSVSSVVRHRNERAPVEVVIRSSNGGSRKVRVWPNKWYEFFGTESIDETAFANRTMILFMEGVVSSEKQTTRETVQFELKGVAYQQFPKEVGLAKRRIDMQAPAFLSTVNSVVCDMGAIGRLEPQCNTILGEYGRSVPLRFAKAVTGDVVSVCVAPLFARLQRIVACAPTGVSSATLDEMTRCNSPESLKKMLLKMDTEARAAGGGCGWFGILCGGAGCEMSPVETARFRHDLRAHVTRVSLRGGLDVCDGDGDT